MTQDELQQSNDKLTARLNKAVEVFKQMKEESDKKDELINSLNEQLAKSKDSIDLNTHEELKKKCEELEKTNKLQADEILGKEKFIKTFQETYNEVFNELTELKSKLNNTDILQKEVNTLKEELSKSNTTIDALNGEVTSLKQNNTNLHSVISEQDEDLSNKNCEIDDLEKKIEEAKNTLTTEISKVKTEYDNEIKTLNSELFKYKNECSNMELEIVSLKDENTKLKDSTVNADIEALLREAKTVITDTVNKAFIHVENLLEQDSKQLKFDISNIHDTTDYSKVSVQSSSAKVEISPEKKDDIDPITGELKYGVGTEPWNSTHGVYPTDSIFQV